MGYTATLRTSIIRIATCEALGGFPYSFCAEVDRGSLLFPPQALGGFHCNFCAEVDRGEFAVSSSEVDRGEFAVSSSEVDRGEFAVSSSVVTLVE